MTSSLLPIPSSFPNYPVSEIQVQHFFESAFLEDIGSSDHSALACFPNTVQAFAQIISKQSGIIAGIEVFQYVLRCTSEDVHIQTFVKDGDFVEKGKVIAEIRASAYLVLSRERICLNIMQRMSGIATITQKYVQQIQHTKCTLLDTRKTTPNFRYFEKWAVRIGGGNNHRFALYDMIMLKDNHIDFAGGIPNAVESVKQYCKEKQLSIPVEVETRNLFEVEQALQYSEVTRIMLDNFTPSACRDAVELIGGRVETEASGNIHFDNIAVYAESGVDFISSGAIIHSAPNFDISMVSKVG